jgi:Macrocin-O-methyltransferase (TylF)
MYINGKKEVVQIEQKVFDAFNNFIFSSDTRIIAKLLARASLVQQVVNVPGDIVELGVFKGSGMATFLKLKDIYFPKVSPLKVIGFDYFDTDKLVKSLKGNDRETMEQLFKDRNYNHTNDACLTLANTFFNMGYNISDFELIAGDINMSINGFVNERPGFRARLVYIDVDLEEPTYNALKALWPLIPTGGIVCFDEYGIHQWSEAIGADKFFEGKAKLMATNIPCPTAYIIKQ